MRFSLPETDAPLAAPAPPSQPTAWIIRLFALLVAVAVTTAIYHAANPRPALPPFVPAEFYFHTEGSRVEARGCFVGDFVPSAINEQRVVVHGWGHCAVIDSTFVASYARPESNLRHTTSEYMVNWDDGDIVRAELLRTKAGEPTEALEISRKYRSIKIIRSIPGGPVLVWTLKDGPTEYRRIVASRKPWF